MQKLHFIERSMCCLLIYFGSPAEVIFIGNYTMLPEQVVEVKLSIAVKDKGKCCLYWRYLTKVSNQLATFEHIDKERHFTV